MTFPTSICWEHTAHAGCLIRSAGLRDCGDAIGQGQQPAQAARLGLGAEVSGSRLEVSRQVAQQRRCEARLLAPGRLETREGGEDVRPDQHHITFIDTGGPSNNHDAQQHWMGKRASSS